MSLFFLLHLSYILRSDKLLYLQTIVFIADISVGYLSYIFIFIIFIIFFHENIIFQNVSWN